MSLQPLAIGGTQIPPDSRQTVEVPLPLLYTHTPVVLAVQVLRGRRDGPRLFLSGAIHGDEINGAEIIRRVLRCPALRKLRGTLIAVPVVNVYGFVRQSRYLPDRRDLNRCFPGSETGSLAARLANAFLREIVGKASHGIDLHTGAVHRENLPQIRGAFDAGGQIEDLAKAFGAPVILNSEMRDGSLREAAAALGVPVLVYEGGEALRFNESAIHAGVQGVLAVMRRLGMIPGSRHLLAQRREAVVAQSTSWVRAPQSGVLRELIPLGSSVRKNDPLGLISDPYGENETPVLAPSPGIVIGRVNLPLVNEGEALYHLARVGNEDIQDIQMEPDPTNLAPGFI